jgi:hypothetical protein
LTIINNFGHNVYCYGIKKTHFLWRPYRDKETLITHAGFGQTAVNVGYSVWQLWYWACCTSWTMDAASGTAEVSSVIGKSLCHCSPSHGAWPEIPAPRPGSMPNRQVAAWTAALFYDACSKFQQRLSQDIMWAEMAAWTSVLSSNPYSGIYPATGLWWGCLCTRDSKDLHTAACV